MLLFTYYSTIVLHCQYNSLIIIIESPLYYNYSLQEVKAMTAKEVGARVTVLREEKKLTKNALANLAGISPTYISDIEAGRKCPTVEYLGYLCDALGITLRDFFSVDGKNDRLSIDSLTARQKAAFENFLRELK